MKPKRILGIVLVASCGLRTGSAAESPMTPERVVSIYSRATNFFSATALFKPLETQPVSPFFGFAPLVLEEVGSPVGAKGTARASVGGERFGALVVSNGVIRVDTGRPALYVAVGRVDGNGGKTYPRFTYVWCYGSSGRPQEEESAPQIQGVRITLDSEGRPGIWEIMADSSGARLVFVSQSLELAAAAQYGKVLEGRRFAVERCTTETPEVIVARVLDDGPVPMGPIVYVMAGSRDVSTVICRCMAAQARTVTEARNYELLSFSAHEDLLVRVRDQSKVKAVFWPGGGDGKPDGLLRLPKMF